MVEAFFNVIRHDSECEKILPIVQVSSMGRTGELYRMKQETLTVAFSRISD